MILDLPFIKCYIDSKYLSDNTIHGQWVEGYVFSVTLIPNRKLMFTVHTEHGAVYSRLPIEALYHELGHDYEFTFLDNEYLDPWGTIGHTGQVIKHRYLKDYHVKMLNVPDTELEGRYWCTIDYFEGGHAEDPEQHKTTNLILLDNGQIAALPNNYCKFIDKHFVNNAKEFEYKRNRVYRT